MQEKEGKCKEKIPIRKSKGIITKQEIILKREKKMKGKNNEKKTRE